MFSYSKIFVLKTEGKLILWFLELHMSAMLSWQYVKCYYVVITTQNIISYVLCMLFLFKWNIKLLYILKALLFCIPSNDIIPYFALSGGAGVLSPHTSTSVYDGYHKICS